MGAEKTEKTEHGDDKSVALGSLNFLNEKSTCFMLLFIVAYFLNVMAGGWWGSSCGDKHKTNTADFSTCQLFSE